MSEAAALIGGTVALFGGLGFLMWLLNTLEDKSERDRAARRAKEWRPPTLLTSGVDVKSRAGTITFLRNSEGHIVSAVVRVIGPERLTAEHAQAIREKVAGIIADSARGQVIVVGSELEVEFR